MVPLPGSTLLKTTTPMNTIAEIDSGAILAKALLNLHAAIEESGAVVTSEPTAGREAEDRRSDAGQNLIFNSIKYRC